MAVVCAVLFRAFKTLGLALSRGRATAARRGSALSRRGEHAGRQSTTTSSPSATRYQTKAAASGARTNRSSQAIET